MLLPYWQYKREKLGLWLLSFSFVFVLLSCGPPKQQDGSLMDEIFGEGEGVFRGLGPGSTVAEVKAAEGGNPRFEDQWGLQYEINLGEDREMRVDYLLQDSVKAIKSIAALISLKDEVEASEQFKAIETRLSRDYGVPEGAFGDYYWEPGEVNLNVQLRLLENKRSLSLNFFRSLAR